MRNCCTCGWPGKYRCRRCLTKRVLELEARNAKLVKMAREFAEMADGSTHAE